MGTVFEAEHLGLGRIVAIKVLHPDQARKKVAVKRFHQEARAAGAHRPPEHLRGLRLRHARRRQPLPRDGEARRRDARRPDRERGRPPVRGRGRHDRSRCSRGSSAAHEQGASSTATSSPRTSSSRERAGCPPLVKLLDFGVSKIDRARASGTGTTRSTSRAPAW